MRAHAFESAAPDGGHLRLAYAEWGEADNPCVVLCLHGLTRNGRDFDDLARALAAEYRVICPDVVGRGASYWLAEPSDYGYPIYIAHVLALLRHLGVTRVDLIGTSMGGLIGMLLAAAEAGPIARLVLNDIGPFVPKAALERIAEYVGADPRFDDLDDLERYLRRVYAGFGPLDDDHWRHLAQHGARALADGGYGLAHDPAIGQAFTADLLDDVDLWDIWDRVACPTLVLRGALSDVLLPETAAEMAVRGPRARVVEIAGVGHAPALMDPEQIGLIRDFLAE